jgi:FtsP/CotA-like multicopper oxidase with cupredoxin domain
LRILNGSNARTYALALVDPFWWNREGGGSRVWYSDCLRVIGNDGGLFARSVKLGSIDYLLISPGERLDVLLDLTGIANVDCLRLVNLAVSSALDPSNAGLEGIFQTDKDYVVPAPGQPILNSVLKPQNDSDPSLFGALKIGQANIMQFCIGSQASLPSVSDAAIDAILANHVDDEGFVGTAVGLVANPSNTLGVAPVRNRLVLLMNNTQFPGGSSTGHPLASLGFVWNDVQMWELGDATGASGTWDLPFSIDTENPNPPAIDTTIGKTYGVHRGSFFQDSSLTPVNPASGYPTVHSPTFEPRAGTYERWYVINLGNAQPVANDTVDMHPFHMHLVNFTVVNRWAIDGGGQLQTNPSPSISDFDGIARHDTVRVQANELLELLVYFPLGYTGDYVYHCHLVEHEDMGMMLHFGVQD